MKFFRKIIDFFKSAPDRAYVYVRPSAEDLIDELAVHRLAESAGRHNLPHTDSTSLVNVSVMFTKELNQSQRSIYQFYFLCFSYPVMPRMFSQPAEEETHNGHGQPTDQVRLAVEDRLTTFPDK